MDYIAKKTKVFNEISPLLKGKLLHEQLNILNEIEKNLNVLPEMEHPYRSTILDLKYEINELINLQNKNFQIGH